MRAPISCLSTLFLLGTTASLLQAGTVTFSYTAPTDATGTTATGVGGFSYTGNLSSIALGDITAFDFHLTLTNVDNIINPVFDYGFSDLLSFSATVGGGVVTSLSLQTGFEFADNTDAFQGERLTVDSLAVGGANNDAQDPLNSNIITVVDTGTITTQGPGGVQAPEPSTALLAGGAGLLLIIKQRITRQPKP